VSKFRSSLRNNLRNALFFYESRIAPLIAIYLGWIYWPFYKILKARNVCFVINIAGGTGHIICELDLFFRRLHQEKIDLQKKYIWIRKNDPFSSTCVRHYGKNFWYAKASYLLYELTLPLTIRYKDITLDCGLSGLQWQLAKGNKYIRPIAGQNYLNLIPLDELTKLWNEYFRLRKDTIGYDPLVVPDLNWKKLEPLVGSPYQKRVLVHLKEKKANATAASTDPNTYLESLQYLHDKKYQFVFVGREAMPSQFRDFSMIPYSQSHLASFEHDIALFQNCSMALIAGSGIAYLADCYRKPYLYINFWHIPTPVFSPMAITIPTLLQKRSGEFLSFQEQIDLFLTIAPDGTVRGMDEYVPRNASGDEILLGFQELEKLIEKPAPPSSLQESMKRLRNEMPISFAASRFSQAFLEKHSDLMKE